jgi:SAM-dependent methyltransferase
VLRRLALTAVALVLCTRAAAQEGSALAPYIHTPADVVERMLELAGTGAGDFVVDLGSGDGRIVIAAARRFGARGLGIEWDASLVAQSRRNAEAAGVGERARFLEGDVLVADLSQATVVTAYLLPDLMWRLMPRFVGELRPGARIVSHAFSMPGWAPDRVEKLRVVSSEPGQGATSTLYLWIVPANARGEWQSGEERIRIAQSYQQISVEGATLARLRGREISWEMPGRRFEGRVEGKRIVGRLQTGAGTREATFLRAR